MRYLLGIVLFLTFLQVSHASNIIIDSTVVYNNANIDLTKDTITIKKGGLLKIKNSKIIGTLSEDHPFLIDVQDGSLVLLLNDIEINAPNIAPHDQEQSLQNAILLENAHLWMNKNNIIMKDPFRAGLLLSYSQFLTNDIIISDNYIEGFHGALYLLNSDNLLIQNNTLKLNSYGNIVISGKYARVIGNSIYLSGRDRLGNSIDLIGATDALLSGNVLFMPTCHGIYSLMSNNVTVEDNIIVGGITYAMTFLSNIEQVKDADLRSMIKLVNQKMVAESNDIVIQNNYMQQNRYGIQASDITNLTINNNLFSQHFDNADKRVFWTNNKNLLLNVTNLVWNNNLYKEAFTQDNNGSNAQTNIVNYPEAGGVHL